MGGWIAPLESKPQAATRPPPQCLPPVVPAPIQRTFPRPLPRGTTCTAKPGGRSCQTQLQLPNAAELPAQAQFAHQKRCRPQGQIAKAGDHRRRHTEIRRPAPHIEAPATAR